MDSCRSVDGGFDFWAVEINFSAVGEIIKGAGEAEDVPEERASCGNLIDVEALDYQQGLESTR